MDDFERVAGRKLRYTEDELDELLHNHDFDTYDKIMRDEIAADYLGYLKIPHDTAIKMLYSDQQEALRDALNDFAKEMGTADEYGDLYHLIPSEVNDRIGAAEDTVKKILDEMFNQQELLLSESIMDDVGRIRDGATAQLMFERGFEVFKDGAKINNLDEIEHLQYGYDNIIAGVYYARKSEIALYEEQYAENIPQSRDTKISALVNGELKELPVIFDSKGTDITADFLRKTIDCVSQYHARREEEYNDDMSYWEYEDLPSTNMIADLPPAEVEDEIKFDSSTNRFEMSADAFDWLEQYAPKHNEVSALESKLLPYICDYPDEQYYDSDDYHYSHCTDYRASDTVNLNGAVNTKSEWLRRYADEKGIDVGDVEKIPDLIQHLSDGVNEQERRTERTDLMPISEVTPQLLIKFVDKTNSIYQNSWSFPECRIGYGVNDSDKTIMFTTIDAIPSFENTSLIPGDVRVAAGRDWGEALFKELGETLESEFHSDLGLLQVKYEDLNPKLADKLTAVLDKNGIPYRSEASYSIARGETVTISVSKNDKQAFERERADLTAALKAKQHEDRSIPQNRRKEKKPSVLGEIFKLKSKQSKVEKEKPAPQRQQTQKKAQSTQER